MPGKRIQPRVECLCEICGARFHPPLSSVGKNLRLRPGTGRFCSRTCSGIGRRGPRLPLAARFWAKVDFDGPVPDPAPHLGPCWLWTGANTLGYGIISRGPGEGNTPAHRLSYELVVGPIPDGMVVRHMCDRPACVRPVHLELGTCKQNSEDWSRRGASPYAGARVRGPLTVEQRFWPKVDRNGPMPADSSLGNCWVWTGATDTKGYGKLGVGGGKGTRPAHRVAYEIEHGPIGDGLFVCHRCDRPCCVRTSHLFLGTQGENLRDMVAKGRDEPKRKLTVEQVREIRRRCAAGESQCSIAKAFSIAQVTVHNIVYRKLWVGIA